jgi:hypothetical protein
MTYSSNVLYDVRDLRGHCWNFRRQRAVLSGIWEAMRCAHIDCGWFM